jgi:hypothetical protein
MAIGEHLMATLWEIVVGENTNNGGGLRGFSRRKEGLNDGCMIELVSAMPLPACQPAPLLLCAYVLAVVAKKGRQMLPF